MSLITSIDDIVNRRAGLKQTFCFKESINTKGDGYFASLFHVDGHPRAATPPPSSSGADLDNTSANSMRYINSGVGKENYLYYVRAGSGVNRTIHMLYDRMWHNSGLNGDKVLSTAITFTGTIDRGAGGTSWGTELWLEVYTSIGAGTTQVLSVSYTNQDGVAGRTATYNCAEGSLNTVGLFVPLRLQLGDLGVQSVQSYSFSAAQSAGNLGLVILRRYGSYVSDVANCSKTYNFERTGLQEIPNDACLSVAVMTDTTSTGRTEFDFYYLES